MTAVEEMDIVSAGSQLRSGSLGAEELTRLFLDRIERLDPVLHAFYAVTADYALARARKADQERASGLDRGPLHGVPIAVKDLYHTAFAPTTGGLSHRIGTMADRNASTVQRLEDAGAVILGKLATTEGAYFEHNPAWPTPLNPWSHAHWPGLSSSGSGVAVAARLCLGALGSDTGGSIRLPSAACGITGLKPTFGRVSGAGVLPLAHGFDHFGPMTRSATDAAILYRVIAGRDPDDSRTAGAPDPDGGESRPAEGLRIGVDRALLERTDPAIADLLLAALRELEAAGAVTVPVRFPETGDMLEAFSVIFAREAAEAHAASFPEHENSYGAALAQALRGGAAVDDAMLESARAVCIRWNAALAAMMEPVDMLALPVLGDPVPQVASMALGKGSGIGTYTIPFNVSGSPTVNFPVGFDAAGLPVALQLIGPHWSEEILLSAAQAYQRRTDWHRMSPPQVN